MSNTKTLETRYMAGSCAHGGAKTGIRWHAVPALRHHAELGKALCGRRPSIQWSDARAEQPVSCPGCLRALQKLQSTPQLAGEDGLATVQPKVGLVAWSTVPETGMLARVRVLRRAQEHDLDGKLAWEWRWLSGPRKGQTDCAYGRSFWLRVYSA